MAIHIREAGVNRCSRDGRVILTHARNTVNGFTNKPFDTHYV